MTKTVKLDAHAQNTNDVNWACLLDPLQEPRECTSDSREGPGLHHTMAHFLDRPRLVTEGRSPRKYQLAAMETLQIALGGRSWFMQLCKNLAGAAPKDGVPDMTVISEIDEYGINENLRVRYRQERIYVSTL